MERSVNSNPFKSAEDAPSLASTSQNNLLEAQVKEQAAQIQKLTEVLNELQQKVNVGKEEGQQSTQQPQAVAASVEQQQQLLQQLHLSQEPPEQLGQQQQQQQLPMGQQQPVAVHHSQPQNTAPFSVAQQLQPQPFVPVLDPITRQRLVQIRFQQQQTQQHQFQQSPPLQRVNNPGLSINPVRMITAGQLLADRQQQQQRRMQLQQQQQHELMGSPPASHSSSQNQLNIQHMQQQQLPQLAARLPTSYNLSPMLNARRAKEQQRKQQHDAGTSSGSVAGELQQQRQQPQHEYAIDATPLRASVPLREGQPNQVGTYGAGPSGYSGDQQQQTQHLRMNANVGGNLVESQRRHSRVEKAKAHQMQQQAQHQFQLSPPLQRVNNPGLSINPVRMITAGQLIADRQQQQLRIQLQQQQQQQRRMQLQLQQQQHELMASPPASRSSSPNQLNIEHLQQQQQRPQPAARLPTSYNLSPTSNARRAKEQQRKQQHDAGTSSGSVAGELQQQRQQPQHEYAIDATPLRASVPLREGQPNQVGTYGAGPSGYSGDQQQQTQHLRMNANVGGNLVESQRRHSRVEKAKAHQMQQQAQHQFQLSPPLQRVNNPGLSINPVRMITAGQLIADRQQQQLRIQLQQQQQQQRRMQLQLQQQQHELMASPPASRSSSPNQLNIEHLQQQQQRPQPAARLPTSYNLSPTSNARRAKEQQRKQQHDAGTSSGSVAGELQQQRQQPQHEYAIDATPLIASVPLREGQPNQVGTYGAGPSGYSGDQQQQTQHLRMNANVGGNLVESQRRHSRVEKAKQIAVTSAASDDNQINNVEKIVIQAISECIKKTLTKYGINPRMFVLSLASLDELTNKYLNAIESNVDHPADIIGELRTFFQPNNGGGGDEAALIVQILDEISMEIDSFDSNGPSSSNSASPEERAAHHQKKRFLFANYRLYHQLSKLLSTTAQQNNGLREAPNHLKLSHKWVTTMDKKLRQILEKFEKQNGHDESVNWCSNLFRLEDAIESAKLALLIAFPPNSLNEWIKNGGKWEMLNDIVDEGKFSEFLAYYDDKGSVESDFIDKIQKYSENECYGMFSEFEVNYLRNLANQIAQNAFVVKPLTMQTNMLNLTITLAILQKIIAEIETNPNMFTLDSVKSDKEIATNFLHLCVSLLDAKFDHFQNQVLARLNEFDRIRKGILDGQGQSSKSK
ncbi:hypothetical protein niasHT_031194 [Heterodera trifolii]|uniref:Uncharacterized protein n=1 Tax=Heterodera trifolii TaxID=157864 RepID=A0ABD2I2A9_9BILA